MEPTPEPAPPIADAAVFLRRVRLATYTVVLLVLSIYLLEKFERILQPFFFALFLGFLTHPIHRWLVARGIPSLIAYGVIFALVLLGILAFGSMMYVNFSEVADTHKLLAYEG